MSQGSNVEQVTTLEELLQEFANALELERNANWRQGDVAAWAVKLYGRQILGKFAEVGRCTVERMRQLVRIAVAFPEEVRYPELPWAWYRALYQAARRLKREPLELLEEALELEYSQADLAGLGREQAAKARLARRCGWCGSRITVETDGGIAGTVLSCPVCKALYKEERQLGVLEID